MRGNVTENRSSKFIKPLYHEWKELEHDADDDDDDEEEDDQRKHSETYVRCCQIIFNEKRIPILVLMGLYFWNSHW